MASLGIWLASNSLGHFSNVIVIVLALCSTIGFVVVHPFSMS